MTYTCRYHSPVGELILYSDETFLKGLWMDGQKYFGSTLRGEHVFPPLIDLLDL